MIYLLHFDPPLVKARGYTVGHYMGYCHDEYTLPRMMEHIKGRNTSNLVKAVHKAGGKVVPVALWPGGTPDDEQRFKRNKHMKAYCYLCRPEPSKEGTWEGMLRVINLRTRSALRWKRHLSPEEQNASAIMAEEEFGPYHHHPEPESSTS